MDKAAFQRAIFTNVMSNIMSHTSMTFCPFYMLLSSLEMAIFWANRNVEITPSSEVQFNTDDLYQRATRGM